MRGLLLCGDTVRSAALRHEIPIPIIDPLLFAEVDGRRYVLTTRLERDQVQRALPDAEVLEYFELGYKELVETGLSMAEAVRKIQARAVRQIGLTEAIVPADFPLGLGDRLREDGVVLSVDEAAIDLRRRTKTRLELEGIRIAQRAAEVGMAAAAQLLARGVPGSDGALEVDGEPLLAEDVRATLREASAEHGAPCPPDVIVASVWQGGGHDPGSGPLPAGLPIQIDIWPRHEETGCWTDMARTFLAGEPVSEHAALIAEQDRLVREALDQAKAAVRPGITGRELFDATCDLFEAAGYPTQRTTDGEENGFQHALGHGVGLEVHEAPALGFAGQDPLVPGDVVAIEPGLWDERAGGVCFEDLVLVTETGGEVLTSFPYDLAPSG
ncbi:MAG TPA: M24 family metallopeptidase [Gaiellaceae bacterium]|nr:M24 family metallopeptidase [Gaiellaceae bacterium]